jgi:peptidoglycan/xylan/chitin deacetylase (PgdA/CDA1 family)
MSEEVYSADRSLKGKFRRRYAKLVHRRPARLALDRPMISFSFDDAPKSSLKGAEILEARGLRGTWFISAGLADTVGPQGLVTDLEDTRRLAAAGHEIANHTFSHLDCGQADGPAITADVDRNEAALRDLGVEAETFAYPYGDVSPASKRALGARFTLARGLHHGLIEAGRDLNQAPAVGIEGPKGEETARGWLDAAEKRKAWLILYTHDVSDTPSPFGCTPGALERLADEAVARGFEIVTVAEGARRAA